MSDKVIIEITKEELEVLRNLEAGMSVAGSGISKALTNREHRLIKEMVAQHPEPLEDGIYLRRYASSDIRVVFVKRQYFSLRTDIDGDLMNAEPLPMGRLDNWTRIADLPQGSNEWL